MARLIKEGQSVYIPFVDGESVFDSQKHPRMYKTIEQFKKSYPGFWTKTLKLLEYAPVVHGKWVLKKDADGTVNLVCSVCGRFCYEDNAPYCYCGAKMDGGDSK